MITTRLMNVRDYSTMMEQTFSRQFEERSSFILYRRTPFAHLPLRSAKAFCVTREEKDRFIADFSRDAPIIQRKMTRDFSFAIVSYVATAACVRMFANHWEVILLVLHLVAIFVIENRRLKWVWDAPIRALKGRPSTDLAPEQAHRFYKQIVDYSASELALGIMFGVIGAASLFGLAQTFDAPHIDIGTYVFVVVLMSYFLIVGLRCLIAAIGRIAHPKSKQPSRHGRPPARDQRSPF
jgi:hypothetical protein